MSEQRHEWEGEDHDGCSFGIIAREREEDGIFFGELFVNEGDLTDAGVQSLAALEILRLSSALAVAEGENTKLRETLANVYKVPGVISAVGDHVEKARNGGSENGQS